MKPNLPGRVDRLEQENNCGRPKYSAKECTDYELARIIADSIPGMTAEDVLAMTDAELQRIIDEG